MIAISIYFIVVVTLCIYLSTLEVLEEHEQTDFISQINQLLPQTQCGECGYEACKPYATAIANGKAEINRCPPGGIHTMTRLAHLTGKPILPLIKHTTPKLLALIEEQHCIGCVKCITACPVDAIIGTAKQMHSVIPQYCTGCKLCIAPCPVDCISMIPVSA